MTRRGLVALLRQGLDRSRWLVGLGLVLAVAGELLLRFGGGPAARASLMDIMLLATPLAGLVIGTIRIHDARDVTELLLAQPVTRPRLFLRLWLQAVAPIALAQLIGLALPFALRGLLVGPGSGEVFALLGATLLLTAIATSLAFVIALRTDDRVRALGTACLAWLAAAVLWDGVVLLVTLLYADRAIEVPVLVLLALNPLDLTRVLLLLGTDGAALLGYTGATLQHALGTDAGRAALASLLFVWLLGPLYLAARTFNSKDF